MAAAKAAVRFHSIYFKAVDVALRKIIIEGDEAWSGVFEIAKEEAVVFARPGPFHLPLAFNEIQTVLVDGDDDDGRVSPFCVRAVAKPQIQGLALKGIEEGEG